MTLHQFFGFALLAIICGLPFFYLVAITSRAMDNVMGISDPKRIVESERLSRAMKESTTKEEVWHNLTDTMLTDDSEFFVSWMIIGQIDNKYYYTLNFYFKHDDDYFHLLSKDCFFISNTTLNELERIISIPEALKILEG